MTKELLVAAFFILSLFFAPKASAQECGFAQHPQPENPEVCTSYFVPSLSGKYPPCNAGASCPNKKYSETNCQAIGIGGVNGTKCCKELGYDFCYQKDKGPDAVDQYDFRCCMTPPTPTPFPTPVVEGCLIDNITTLNCIPNYFQRIVNFALMFAGVVALIFIIHAGLKFVISSGDPKRVEDARNTFVYAIIGLIIVLFAFLVINIVSFVTGVNCIKFFGFECL